MADTEKDTASETKEVGPGPSSTPEQQVAAPLEKPAVDEPVSKPPSTTANPKLPDSENVTIANGGEASRTESENGDLEKQGAPVSEEEEASPGEDVVFWDGDEDPANPYNWPSWRKVVNCVLISTLSFLTPLGSSMFAPGVPDVMREFQSTSRTLGAFVVSVYVLGFAAGPMLFAPLSEIYGRSVVYHSTNVCFVAFTVACAVAPSFDSLIAFRFLAGLFGSVPLTNGAASIADIMTPDKRGAAMSTFAVGPLLGPIVGPVAGGYISQALGWRWVFWVLSCLSGATTFAFFALASETYAPILLDRKTRRLRRETGNDALRSRLDDGLLPRDYFARGIVRPFRLLLFSPVCVIAGLYVALAYGYMYLVFSSLAPLFQQIYRFRTGEAGLAFLGFGVGCMAGVVFFARSSDAHIRKKAAEEALAAEAEGREPAGFKPEYRLPPLRYGAFLMPIGLFVYGWAADYRVHWIVPIIGTAIMGVGTIIIFMMYLVDSFDKYSASALASNSVMRSVLGAVLPLAAFPMYDKLGLGWGNSLLGFIAAALIPAPWLIIRYGEYLRTRFEIKNL